MKLRWLALVSLVLATGCGSSGSRASSQDTADAAAPTAASLVVRATGHPALKDITNPAQRAARIRAIETHAGLRYKVELQGERARLGTILVGLDAAPAVTARSVQANRVEFRRGPDLTEWYQQGPLGLEQGFDVAKGGAEIKLHVAVTGATPAQAGDGEIALVEGARIAARYGEAYAFDATGRSLGVKLVAEAGGIEIRVATDHAVFPVEIDPLVWKQQTKLIANGHAPNDRFGSSVALAGDTALVGAPDKNSFTGAAYVFTRSGSSWSQQQELTASDGATGDWFGSSVALSGNAALIGAENKSNGAAYAFVRTGTAWSQQQKLLSSDASAEFGTSVAIDGATALGGSWGAAYVFVFTHPSNLPPGWSQQQKLVGSDIASGDQFGASVALSGDTALAGAFQQNSNTGAAYVFVRSGTTWSQQQKLLPSDSTTGDAFGYSVALSGDTALVGASQQNSSTGAAYVFVRSGTTWTQQQKLLASDAHTSAGFGGSVALSGDTALVGAEKGHGNTGSAYVFVRSGTTWTQQGELLAGDAQLYDYFGISVGVTADTAVVGANSENSGTGAAYTFAVTYPNGTTCPSKGAGYCTSGICVDGYCCDSVCDQPCQTCSATPGTCSPVTKGTASTCGAYVCDGVSGACPTACSDDSTCATGYYCNANGNCVAQKTQGKSCSANGDCKTAGCRVCATGNCVDGVCCDTACNGTCQACTGAKKGSGSDGTCGTVADGTDPDSECAPNTCHAGMCATSCTNNSDCAQGTVCAGGGCITPAAQGATCNTNLACQSGNCVDGYCCDTTCTGQCEACDVAGSEGTCSPVKANGQPHGTTRAPCKGDGSKCSGSCNGTDRTQCQYLPAGNACGTDSCKSGSAQTSECDGQGACVAKTPQTCSPYVCGADACLKTCTQDTDCASGYQCKNGSCTPSTSGSTCKDANTQRKADGTLVPCGAFLCNDAAGTCYQVCNGSTECAAGYACDPTSKTCEKTSSGSSSNNSSGCGCRTAGNSSGGSAPWLLLLGLGLLAVRRQRD